MFQTITTGPDGFGEGMEDLHIPLVLMNTLHSRIFPQSLESARIPRAGLRIHFASQNHQVWEL